MVFINTFRKIGNKKIFFIPSFLIFYIIMSLADNMSV